MSRFPWGMVVPVVFAVAVVLAVFGWLDEAAVGVLGLTTTTAVVWLSLLGVRAVLDAKRPIPEVHERLSYPKIAALEHSEGLFDLYTSLGAEGHDPHVADACRLCAQERHAEIRASEQMLSPGEFLVPGGRGQMWRDERSARDFTFSAYEAGLISADQIGDLGLTYERAVVVPVRPPNLVCRHVWQKRKGSEAADRFGTRYMQYGCLKCTSTRTCSEGTSPYG